MGQVSATSGPEGHGVHGLCPSASGPINFQLRQGTEHIPADVCLEQLSLQAWSHFQAVRDSIEAFQGRPPVSQATIVFRQPVAFPLSVMHCVQHISNLGHTMNFYSFTQLIIYLFSTTVVNFSLIICVFSPLPPLKMSLLFPF